MNADITFNHVSVSNGTNQKFAVDSLFFSEPAPEAAPTSPQTPQLTESAGYHSADKEFA